jgi:acyl-coenzyme A synthetase/AMP-(fatty) acid ligase
MKAGEELVKQFDLSSLRHLISVGEPLNAEAVIWSEKVSVSRSMIRTGKPKPDRS